MRKLEARGPGAAYNAHPEALRRFAVLVPERVELFRADLFAAGASRVDVGENVLIEVSPAKTNDVLKVLEEWGFGRPRTADGGLALGHHVRAKNPFREAIEGGSRHHLEARRPPTSRTSEAVLRTKQQGGE